MINRILLFLSILLMINVVMVGIGVYDQGVLELDQYQVINKDVEELQDLSTATEVVLVDIGESDSVEDSESQLSLLPEASEGYASLKTINKLAKGLVFGWTMIFVVLGLPALLTFGLISIIGLIQIFSMFYLIAYFISALRGGIK